MSIIGVLAFIVGVIYALGMILGTPHMEKVLLAILGLGSGLVLIWTGNRLQGYGMLGKRKKARQ